MSPNKSIISPCPQGIGRHKSTTGDMDAYCVWGFECSRLQPQVNEMVRLAGTWLGKDPLDGPCSDLVAGKASQSLTSELFG